MQSAKDQMDLQAAVRINAQEMHDNHKDLLHWMEQIKNDEKRIKSTPEPPTVVEAPTSRAEIYKTEGNEFFKKGDFANAIKYYTKAVAADRSSSAELLSLLYTNRALCHMKLENYEECLIDCNDSLSLDPKNEKTYYRRMFANDKLNNHALALKDCHTLLKLNPNNTAGKEYLARTKTNNAASIAPKEIRRYKSKLDGVGKDVNFIKKPAHLQSRNPLKRIEIVDKSAVLDNKTISNGEPDNAVGDIVQEKAEPKPQPAPEESSRDIDISFIEKQEKNLQHDYIDDKKVVKDQENHAIRSEKVPPPPTSSAMFFNTWKNLTDTQARYSYLKNIPQSDFSALVSSQLDSAILSQILDVLSEWFVRDRVPVLGFLRELSKSPEMSILSLMMSSTDKLALQTLVDFSNQLHKDEMQAITKAFSI